MLDPSMTPSEAEDPLEGYFRDLPRYNAVTDAERELLQHRRDEVIPRLLAIAEEGWRDTLVAAKAVCRLCILEEPRVFPIARRMLLERTEDRWACRGRRILTEAECRFLASDPEIRLGLMSGLDSDDSVRLADAVQDCGTLRVAGAIDRFRSLMSRPDLSPRVHSRLAYWIASTDATVEDVNAIYAAWLEDIVRKDGNLGQHVLALQMVIEEGSPEAHRAATSALLEWLGLIRDGRAPFDPSLSNVDLHGVFQALRSAAKEDPRCVEAVVGVLQTNKDLNAREARAAVSVVAAGSPDRLRTLCSELLSGSTRPLAEAAAEALGESLDGTEDDDAVSEILDARSRLDPRRGDASPYDEALIRIGGERAVSVVETERAGEMPCEKMWTFWWTRKLTTEGALARLEALGVLPAGLSIAALSRAARESDAQLPGFRPTPLETFWTALYGIGVAIMLDFKGQGEPRYDLALLRLGQATRGRFIIDEARQAGDHVEFRHASRTYTFRVRGSEEAYDIDVAAMLTALNQALQDTGRRERFYDMDDYSDPGFILLTPEAARVARDELFLPIIDFAPGSENEPPFST